MIKVRKIIIIASVFLLIIAAIVVPVTVSHYKSNRADGDKVELSYEVCTDDDGNVTDVIIVDDKGNKISVPNNESFEIETNADGEVTGIYTVSRDGETKPFDAEEVIQEIITGETDESVEGITLVEKGTDASTSGTTDSSVSKETNRTQETTTTATTEDKTVKETKPAVQADGFVNIVVFVQFTNSGNFVADKTDMINKSWNDTSFIKSLKGYLNAVSYGKFTVNNIFPQYDSTKNQYAAYTVAEPGSEYELLTNVINKIKLDSTIDVDSNNDGLVDNLTIVVNHSKVSDRNSIFYDHKAQFEGTKYINGLQVYNYNLLNSSSVFDTLDKYGVVCHEFMHSIGYPDLYCYNSSDNEPVGHWDIMAKSSCYIPVPLAYMRYFVSGWTNVGSISGSTNGVTVSSALSSTGKQAYILKSPMSDTEFFVIEFRKQAAKYSEQLDEKIPGSGLIVYRIDTTVENLSNASGRYAVYVFRTGITNENSCGTSMYNSYFSTECGRTSIGSSKVSDGIKENALTFSDGRNSGIVIKNIGSSAGSTITCDIEYNNMAASSYWSSYSGNLTSELKSYYVNGNEVQICSINNWNGTCYALYADNSYNLKLGKITGNNITSLCKITGVDNWQTAGMTARSDGLYIAYGNQNISVSKYDGSLHNIAGNIAGNSLYSAISIGTAGDNVYVAARDCGGSSGGYQIRTFRVGLTGSTNELSCPAAGDSISFASDGTNLYMNVTGSYGNKGCRVYKLSGSSFTQTGNTVSSGSICYSDIILYNGYVYVVVADQNTGTTYVSVCSNGTFSKFGENVTSTSADGVELFAENGQIITAYISNGNYIAKGLTAK